MTTNEWVRNRSTEELLTLRKTLSNLAEYFLINGEMQEAYPTSQRHYVHMVDEELKVRARRNFGFMMRLDGDTQGNLAMYLDGDTPTDDPEKPFGIPITGIKQALAEIERKIAVATENGGIITLSRPQARKLQMICQELAYGPAHPDDQQF